MLVFCQSPVMDTPGVSLDEIMNAYKLGEAVQGLHLLCCDAKASPMLLILSMKEAMKQFYADRRLKVVGMAFDAADARRLLAEMIAAYAAAGRDVAAFKKHCLGLEERE